MRHRQIRVSCALVVNIRHQQIGHRLCRVRGVGHWAHARHLRSARPPPAPLRPGIMAAAIAAEPPTGRDIP